MTEKFLIDNIEKVYAKKGYRFFKNPYSVNIFGIRMVTNTDDYDDLICVAYYDNAGKLHIEMFIATTDPGTHWLKNPMRKEGCAIMVEGQYLGAFIIGPHGSSKYEACRQNKPIPVYRDNNKDDKHDLDPSTIQTGIFWTNIHHGWSAKKVGRNSAGCQVIQSKSKFEKKFMPLVKKSVKLYGSNFTYTLFNKEDFK